ncbi:MAG: asparagine synthase (glutamine-hydrolyzing) [Acidobacteria bacterium]|nr:asparagine synthase (glutamine-hydrolyzing) [Acidobacteriota bacterium]
MCGICGVAYGQRDRIVAPGLLEAMCRTLVHRGPDDQGTFVDRHVGLGNRRLSIIDLEGGHQPIHNEDQTVWVVLNGEIYNYLDLTQMLERRGHHFYTKSDTEAIVHAYEEFGDECLEHLNGMFAFALWDAPRQRIILARDRAGIKPLYYALHDGALIFGSELKAILAYPGLPRSVDLVALNEYLSFEYVPAPRTIFRGISKLLPGHAMSFEDGRLRTWKYWDINLTRSENVQRKPLAEYETELLQLLREAVRKEMVSDVPIGVLLSGGIDSSAVAALMVEASPGRVQSFSISFEDPTFDESCYARLAARTVGTEHHELLLTATDVAGLLPPIANSMDEPLGDSSLLPTYILSQLARQHVKVALGGDGGDELFGGYSTLQAHRLVEYYERYLPSYLRQRVAPRMAELLPTSFNNISLDFKLRRFLLARGVPPAVRHHYWLGSFRPEEKERLLQPWARLTEKDTYDVVFRHLEQCTARAPMNQLLYCDFKLYMEGGMLPKVDRMSMANSLEVRAPLLNHTLVKYVARIPHELKLHGLTTKYLLRRSMRGLLPSKILRRGKKGFNIPVAKWLAGPLRELAESLLSPERLSRSGFFNPSYVRTLLDEHMTGRKDNRKLLWTLLAFQLWHERWMVDTAKPADPAPIPRQAPEGSGETS